MKRPDFVTAHNNAESLFIVCFGPICTLWNSLCSKLLVEAKAIMQENTFFQHFFRDIIKFLAKTLFGDFIAV